MLSGNNFLPNLLIDGQLILQVLHYVFDRPILSLLFKLSICGKLQS